MTYSVPTEYEVFILTVSMPRHVEVWRPLVSADAHNSPSAPGANHLSVVVLREGDIKEVYTFQRNATCPD